MARRNGSATQPRGIDWRTLSSARIAALSPADRCSFGNRQPRTRQSTFGYGL